MSSDAMHIPIYQEREKNMSPEKRWTYKMQVLLDWVKQIYTIISQPHLNLKNSEDKKRIVDLIQRDFWQKTITVEIEKILKFYPNQEK